MALPICRGKHASRIRISSHTPDDIGPERFPMDAADRPAVLRVNIWGKVVVR
jgi:hypothetical protein